MTRFMGLVGWVLVALSIVLMHFMQKRLPVFVDSLIMMSVMVLQLSAFAVSPHRACVLNGQPGNCLLSPGEPTCDTMTLLAMVGFLEGAFLIFEMRSSRTWVPCLLQVVMYVLFSGHSALSPEGLLGMMNHTIAYAAICLITWLGRYHAEMADRKAWNQEKQLKKMVTIMEKMLDLCIHSSAHVTEDGGLDESTPAFEEIFGPGPHDLYDLCKTQNERERAKNFVGALVGSSLPQMVKLSLCSQRSGEEEGSEWTVIEMNVYGIPYHDTTVLGFQEFDRHILGDSSRMDDSLEMESRRPPAYTIPDALSEDSADDGDGEVFEFAVRVPIADALTSAPRTSGSEEGASSDCSDSVSARSQTCVSVSTQGSKKTYRSVVSTRPCSGASITEITIALRKRDLGTMLMEDPEIQNMMRWSEYEIEFSELKFPPGGGGIGSGNFGKVLMCYYGATSVAVKLLPGASQARPLQRIRREIGTLFRLRHPHILTMIGAITKHPSKGTLIITELCVGCSVHERIFKFADMTLPAGLTISMQVAQAVAYMHSVHCCHRDLKPDNIFLATTGLAEPLAKLGDFGLSRVEGTDGIMTPHVGTLGFMAPELYTETYDSAADVFSLGVCTFVVIMRQKVFTRKEVVAYFEEKALADELPPQLRSISVSYLGELISVVCTVCFL